MVLWYIKKKRYFDLSAGQGVVGQNDLFDFNVGQGSVRQNDLSTWAWDRDLGTKLIFWLAHETSCGTKFTFQLHRESWDNIDFSTWVWILELCKTKTKIHYYLSIGQGVMGQNGHFDLSIRQGAVWGGGLIFCLFVLLKHVTRSCWTIFFTWAWDRELCYFFFLERRKGSFRTKLIFRLQRGTGSCRAKLVFRLECEAGLFPPYSIAVCCLYSTYSFAKTTAISYWSFALVPFDLCKAS